MANEGKNALLLEIERIKTNINNSYIRAEQKGATLPQPSQMNSGNLPDTISTISSNGGGNFEKLYVVQIVSNDTCILQITSSGNEINQKAIGQIVAGNNGKLYIVEV